ncbi:hypothetical protein [Shewanella livingstonensis]|uniref:Uncharacterized protein n=1 Tax=Shewanella livingstonensis TaxID=150120 RepID=A0A3G8LX95_9GAMM|nr:hypothetical protein [Shewanella livingstonensis]AZG73340.1 hypothetical protein EGC82_11545 [Shewanella livingstonensis]
MNRLNVSIDADKVAQLIKAGHLCAADLQCLDRASKQTVWQLCLWSCQKRSTCNNKQCQQPYKLLNAADHCIQQFISDQDIAVTTYINGMNSKRIVNISKLDADK